jgi:predicted nucleic acid-binding protein
VRFWDTSAIVPLLLAEATSPHLRETLAEDHTMVVWWGTSVECASALARSARERRVSSTALGSTMADLARLTGDWIEIDPSAPVRLVAERLARTHPLRASDALQLSAAIAAAEGSPPALPFVTFDERLARAALLEGFPVLIPSRP